ncbi:MAG: molybdopterin-dependent oxidoreductase, partial [bacterium]
MSLHPSTCPLDCPDACGVLLETDEHGRFTGLRGNPEHSWSEGHLCGKTAIYHEVALGANRLRVPLVRQGGELREASWDEALDRIAEGVGALAGEELLALSYAGSMGLMARHGPMRVMNALGARSTDGSICDSTSAEGHQVVLGDAVGPDLEKVVDADLLVIWGCDARRTMQHLMPRVKQVIQR